VGSRFAERGGWWLVGQLPLMLAGILVPVWHGELASGPTRWIAASLLLAGMALGLASRRALGASFTPYPHPVEGGSRVERGPYRYVRHPMYAAIVAAFAGWALLWQCAMGALITAALLVFFDLKARREERWLAQAHPGYDEYKRRTRKLVPFLY
jgi:protein-S-isoprenylcysteine O-methyltransferase Ste14